MTERTDPDLVADERTALVQWLEYHRATLAMKAEGLTDEQARTPSVPPSGMSIMGLVRHMAEVERWWFRDRFAGEDVGPIFSGSAHPTGDRDGDFHPSPTDTLADALAAWQHEVDIARRIVEAATSMDERTRGLPTDSYPEPIDLRWIMIHMVEEYARHNGHADLIREALDGTVGD